METVFKESRGIIHTGYWEEQWRILYQNITLVQLRFDFIWPKINYPSIKIMQVWPRALSLCNKLLPCHIFLIKPPVTIFCLQNWIDGLGERFNYEMITQTNCRFENLGRFHYLRRIKKFEKHWTTEEFTLRTTSGSLKKPIKGFQEYQEDLRDDALTGPSLMKIWEILKRLCLVI